MKGFRPALRRHPTSQERLKIVQELDVCYCTRRSTRLPHTMFATAHAGPSPHPSFCSIYTHHPHSFIQPPYPFPQHVTGGFWLRCKKECRRIQDPPGSASAFQKDRDILLEQARYRHIQLPKAYQSKKALLDFIEKDDKRNKRVLPASAPGPAPAPPVPQPSGSRSRSRSRSQPPDLKRQRTATPELLDYPLSEDEEE